MRNNLLLAATAIALLAGTAAASAQNTYQHIQTRDFRQSQGQTRYDHRRGYYGYRGYGWGPGYAYDAAPGYYGYGEGPGVYVAPGWGYRRNWWGW